MSDTSNAAAIASLPNRAANQARVLDALTAAGEQGLTDHELSEVLSRTGIKSVQTSCGVRRGELVKAGLVSRRLVLNPEHPDTDGSWLVPDKRPTPSNGWAAVWVLAQFSQPRSIK